MSQHAIATALLVQRDALRFAEADADANMELDWDEFYSMQPSTDEDEGEKRAASEGRGRTIAHRRGGAGGRQLIKSAVRSTLVHSVLVS